MKPESLNLMTKMETEELTYVAFILQSQGLVEYMFVDLIVCSVESIYL
jgi:hypothetical protein